MLQSLGSLGGEHGHGHGHAQAKRDQPCDVVQAVISPQVENTRG
jgi:hypothetical protein